jgi:hypothetical protein
LGEALGEAIEEAYRNSRWGSMVGRVVLVALALMSILGMVVRDLTALGPNM